MLASRPDLRPYLIRKVLFWPYYFFTEKSPLERISELFFKQYGNKGQHYYGSRGIKNFLNDFFRGKERYSKYIKKAMLIEITKESPVYEEYKKHFPVNKAIYANFICARYQQKYLLRITCGTKDVFNYIENVTTYDLDACERLTKEAFHAQVSGIDPNLANKLINILTQRVSNNKTMEN